MLQLDWASNPNIRPACLPEYTAGDYDQWMSTVTGQHVDYDDNHHRSACLHEEGLLKGNK